MNRVIRTRRRTSGNPPVVSSTLTLTLKTNITHLACSSQPCHTHEGYGSVVAYSPTKIDLSVCHCLSARHLPTCTFIVSTASPEAFGNQQGAIQAVQETISHLNLYLISSLLHTTTISCVDDRKLFHLIGLSRYCQQGTAKVMQAVPAQDITGK